MIKKIFFIALFFLSFNSFSQNIDQIRSVADFSSESELVSYVEKAKLKGLNLIRRSGQRSRKKIHRREKK